MYYNVVDSKGFEDNAGRPDAWPWGTRSGAVFYYSPSKASLGESLSTDLNSTFKTNFTCSDCFQPSYIISDRFCTCRGNLPLPVHGPILVTGVPMTL